jgi:dipeptidyl aminopeptidase/acylaminoacyl peptidase
MRLLLVTTLTILSATSWSPAPQAQQKRMLQPEDYGRWEQLSTQPTPLSPDGKWLVYGIVRSNRQNELRVQPSDGGEAIVIPFGERPAFTEDSKWLAYSIGFSEEQEAKLRKEKKPLHRQLGLLELATGKKTTVDGIESFALAPTGTHIAMRRYGAERESAGAGSGPTPGGGNTEVVQPGTALVIRELATGRDTTFASVTDLAWQDEGSLLAFAVTVEGGVGNGVQLFDASTSSVRALDSSSAVYTQLTWRKESASLAVLRSTTNDDRVGPSQLVLVWPDVAKQPDTRSTLDASKAGLAPDLRVVRFYKPRWSEDGTFIYVGVAPWLTKPARSKDAVVSRRISASSDNPDEMPDVQVWHPKDTTVMSKQKIDAPNDRQRSTLAAWSIADGKLVRIANAIGEEASPIPHQPRVLVVDNNAFAMERSIGRHYANVWIADAKSGLKSATLDRVEDRYLQPSPHGKYLLFLKNDHYWTLDVASGKQTNITATIATSFVDKESDETIAQKPAFGVAGWTADDGAVLLYDKFDIWEVKPDGAGATRLTNGAAGEIRARVVDLDPKTDWIDRQKPVHVRLFGLRSKKSGYGVIPPGASGAATSLVWLDKRVDRLAKARLADRYAYAVQGFDDSPDYFVGATLPDAKQITTTNPFMSDYAWGRSVVIDYKTAAGHSRQASLFYPAGYEAGKTYPMVVYMYEKLSDGVHDFSVPSERDYYNAASFVTQGYVYLQPDIVFRKRDPGLSVVESVVPAVQKVVQMGIADPKRVGTLGHSWGGFDSAFLATNTTTFAASVAGAPIVNLVSNYGNFHWNNGIAETDHIETGQQRMEVPLYEDLPAYLRNSAVFKANTMTTPLLIEVGDQDGVVFWHQGLELYNIARRAGKPVVLLQYGGENHPVRKRANQIDYHHRIIEWFDHYLKGAPAASWITDGERYIDRERDIEQRKLPLKGDTKDPSKTDPPATTKPGGISSLPAARR